MRVKSRCAVALALATLLVCPAPSWGQQASGGVDGLLERFNLKAKLAPASPFVTESRSPRKSNFIPVGTPHPDRSVKIMSPAEVAAAEADLDASREKQQRRAGRTPAVVPVKPAKKAAKATVP